MNELDYFYEIDFNKLPFLHRKVSITKPNTLLVGSPKSGKSFLIYEYLSKFEPSGYLYLDFNDFRLDKTNLKSSLNKFLKDQNIDILALDNFDFSFSLPDVKNLIVSTDDCTKHIPSFEKLNLYPLDFEEYILFDKKFIDEQTSFNHFINIGSLPEMPFMPSFNIKRHFHQIINTIAPTSNQLYILKEFAKKQSMKVSLLQTFNSLKTQNVKISKDKFYDICNEFENKNILFFMHKYNHPKAPKRVYLFDFMIRDIMFSHLDIYKKFENMIFLEFLNKNYDIYYTDYFTFYIPSLNKAILVLPFSLQDSVQNKISQKSFQNEITNLNIKQIDIITLGLEKNFDDIDDVICIASPFWKWAILNT